MRTASDRIAVIAMQIARTDRRALSQAWYESLYGSKVAGLEGAAPQAARPPRFAEGPRSELATTPKAGRDGAALAPLPGVANPSTAMAARSERIVSEASPSADRASRAIARAVARAAEPRRSFAQTVELGGGRIRLLVRTQGDVTRIVAVCAAAERERVARALAGARVALAAAGAAVAA